MTPGVRPQPEKKDDFFEQGVMLAKEGRWKEALAALRRDLPRAVQHHVHTAARLPTSSG